MKKRKYRLILVAMVVVLLLLPMHVSAQGPKRVPAPITRYYQKTAYLSGAPCTVVIICTETYTNNSGSSVLTYNVGSAYLYNSPGCTIISEAYDGSAGVGSSNQLYVSIGIRKMNGTTIVGQSEVSFLIEGNSLVNP